MGRTDILRLMPLNFIQFCKFWAVYRKADKYIEEFLRLAPEKSFYAEPLAYCSELIGNAWRWEGLKPYVNAALDEYLLIGGYPEYFADGSAPLWQKRLVDDIIGQGLYRDIVSIYKLKTPEKLEKLLYFIADNNGQDFNFKTIADTIGCDNETVNAYLTYLSQAYMVIALSNYSPNAGKTIRKNKALYVLDNGIANALLRLPKLNDTQAGQIAESVCARDAYAVCEARFWSLHYWREKGVEVDFVIDRKTDIMPVEIKYRSDAKRTSLAMFRRAFPDLKINASAVITKDDLRQEQDTLYVPFWLVR